MNGERSYTTKIWPQPYWIESWSVDGSFISMDLRGGPAISNWKRPCFQGQNGSEFPELAAHNFRNPQAVFDPAPKHTWFGADCGVQKQHWEIDTYISRVPHPLIL